MSTFIKPFCISAYVIHKNSGKYLLIRRCGKYLTGTWQMITGGIESGETCGETCKREILEETGLTPTRIYSGDAVETFYYLKEDKIAFVPVFVAFVDSLDVRLSPTEHDAYEWLPYEQAVDRLVWSEQRRIIKQIHENFILKDPHHLLEI